MWANLISSWFPEVSGTFLILHVPVWFQMLYSSPANLSKSSWCTHTVSEDTTATCQVHSGSLYRRVDFSKSRHLEWQEGHDQQVRVPLYRGHYSVHPPSNVLVELTRLISIEANREFFDYMGKYSALGGWWWSQALDEFRGDRRYVISSLFQCRQCSIELNTGYDMANTFLAHLIGKSNAELIRNTIDWVPNPKEMINLRSITDCGK